MENLDLALKILEENGFVPLEIHFPRSDLWEMLRKTGLDTIRQYNGLQVFFLGDTLRIYLGDNLWGDIRPNEVYVYKWVRIFTKPSIKEEVGVYPLTNHDNAL